MAPGSVHQRSIAEVATCCTNLFQECMQQEVITSWEKETLIGDQRCRFNLWASNIWVFSQDRESLDYRLRDDPRVGEIIFRIIEDIEHCLGKCVTFLQSRRAVEPYQDGDPDRKLDTIMKECTDAITLLYHLNSVVYRAVAVVNAEVFNEFRILDEEGNDIEPCLRNAFSDYIRDEFPQIDEYILRRLVSAMVTRRKRILNKRSRSEAIRVHLQETIPQPTVDIREYELRQTATLDVSPARTDQPSTTPEANDAMNRW
ncbi:Serine/threonine-protein phosphatase [Aspergillus melleus]|nr:Serine/threonine-protein phosphatase [Aspergillus melleus]KAH8422319.1 Serine/threonine-protein phosphatase [Aspergillus melleus]